MDWSELFEFIGKAATAGAAVIGAWWAFEKWRRRDEHFPRIYFEVSVNFLGSKDEFILVELIATLENKGVVPLKISNFSFKLLGLKETDAWVRGDKGIRGQLKFPHLLEEGTFMPLDRVYPGVKTEYNYVAAIPLDVSYVRIQGDFEYLHSRASHHAAKVLKVYNTALKPTP
ncbi:hypothetical protein BVY01_02945 [bacterium I07]|nr:hypothetical protein BVY01_02945 [bacterium I07]